MHENHPRYALIRAFQDALRDFVEAERAEMFAELVESYEESGAKSWDIQLPGEDGKVATLSLTFSKAEPAIDSKQEFTDWAMFNAPDLVKTVVVPAREDIVPKSTALQTLLDDYGAQPTADGTLVTQDGEEIPGVHVARELPKTFALRWAKQGRERVEAAYGEGRLNGLTVGTPMPELGS